MVRWCGEEGGALGPLNKLRLSGNLSGAVRESPRVGRRSPRVKARLKRDDDAAIATHPHRQPALLSRQIYSPSARPHHEHFPIFIAIASQYEAAANTNRRDRAAFVAARRPQWSRSRAAFAANGLKAGFCALLITRHHPPSPSYLARFAVKTVSRRPALADSPFDEHLIVIGYSDGRDGGGQHEQRVLLDGPSVRLAGGGGPSTSAGPRLSWWSDAHGGMVVDGNLLTLDLALPDGMRLVANASGTRVPWDARSPDTYGPEGWLSRTGLLPCHYFVHSFGSRTQYALWHRRNTQNNALWNRPTGIGSQAPLLIGEARARRAQLG